MPSLTSAGYTVKETKAKRRKPEHRKPHKPGKHGKRPSHAAIVSVFVFLFAVLLSAGVLFLYLETKDYADRFLPGIFIAGEPLDGMTYEQAVARLKTLENRDLSDFTYTFECEEDAYTLTAEDMGLVYDTDESLLPLYATGRDENLIQRFLTMRHLKEEPLLGKPVIRYDLGVAETLLEEIRDSIICDPVDATVTFDANSSVPFVYTEELQGLRVDTSDALKAIQKAVQSAESGVFEIEVEQVPAKRTREAFEQNMQILSRITVSLGNDASAENAELALLQLSGRRIEPGDSLSFNQTVGERTEENGYVHAREQAYGYDVSGIGGGICQASSLLYQGALLAGLSVTERNPAAGVVSFCQPGEEATVSDQGLDLVIQNGTDYPVFIRCRVYQEAEVKMACMELFGSRQYESVTLLHETETLPASSEPVYLLDKTGTYATYNDEFVLRNDAIPGLVVTTDLVTRRKNETVASRTTISTDRYEPIPTCYWIGSQIR